MRPQFCDFDYHRSVTLDYYRPEKPRKPSANWVLGVACLVAGVVVPAICFTFSLIYGSPLSPEWQSGEPGGYLKLQLEGKVTWPFFPLLLYSMISMLLALVRPQRFSRLRAVRLGVYSGVVLALQYVVIMQAALGASDVGPLFLAYVIVAAVPILVMFIFRAIVRNFRSRRMWAILTPIGIVALGLYILLHYSQRRLMMAREVFGGSLFLMLGAGPLWALIAYGWLSARLWRESDDQGSPQRFRTFLPFLGWLTAYGVAWRFAFLRAVAVYCSLPTNAPNRCYVCSAAANGHVRLVRARTIRRRDGSVSRINDQLCRLKLAELAMLALMPRVHRTCRRIYDALGPVVASQLRDPFAADVAYLSLKPAEWISLVMLRLIIKDPTKLLRCIYSRERGSF